MLSHALTIITNELNKHISKNYSDSTNSYAILGNLSDITINSDLREKIYISLVNIKEEKTLKNLPHRKIDQLSFVAAYQNQPIFVNFLIIASATHKDYSQALLMLSRVIRFFQFNNVFTQDSVDRDSIIKNAPPNNLDQLEEFKLIFDLYSPTLEEVNHLWGTLGGKQYPFVLYILRMLDLKFHAPPIEGKLVTEVVSNFSLKMK